jgi:hypothetical protein
MQLTTRTGHGGCQRRCVSKQTGQSEPGPTVGPLFDRGAVVLDFDHFTEDEESMIVNRYWVSPISTGVESFLGGKFD